VASPQNPDDGTDKAEKEFTYRLHQNNSSRDLFKNIIHTRIVVPIPDQASPPLINARAKYLPSGLPYMHHSIDQLTDKFLVIVNYYNPIQVAFNQFLRPTHVIRLTEPMFRAWVSHIESWATDFYMGTFHAAICFSGLQVDASPQDPDKQVRYICMAKILMSPNSQHRRPPFLQQVTRVNSRIQKMRVTIKIDEDHFMNWKICLRRRCLELQ